MDCKAAKRSENVMIKFEFSAETSEKTGFHVKGLLKDEFLDETFCEHSRQHTQVDCKVPKRSEDISINFEFSAEISKNCGFHVKWRLEDEFLDENSCAQPTQYI